MSTSNALEFSTLLGLGVADMSEPEPIDNIDCDRRDDDCDNGWASASASATTPPSGFGEKDVKKRL